MYAPDMALYPILVQFLLSLYGPLRLASLHSLSQAVWSLLLSQSLHTADLGRSIPYLQTAKARQAMRSVRRLICRHHLTGQYLAPLLIRAVLCLVPNREIILILDSTRCVRWEIFTLGIMLGGRVLPIAWAILPYPWPKGSFTPTVVELVSRTLASWPQDRPLHLLADRGFPSLRFFQLLDNWRKKLPLGYTIRLRAGDWVRLNGRHTVKMAHLMTGIPLGSWSTYRASYQQGQGNGALALLVVGRGVPVYPTHQMGPADQARRGARQKRRIAHVLSKGQANSPHTDTIWALLSTALDCPQAIGKYSLRFSTEGTYRDLKSWGLEAVAAKGKDIRHLDGLMGLAALAYFTQLAIGMEAGRATQGEARARQQQWSTTDRLSLFWRGRQVIHDHAHDWRPWLRNTLSKLANQIDPRTSLATRGPTKHQEAA